MAKVTRRRVGARRTRDACPMATCGVVCHAYGNEAACLLCSMVDWASPVTIAGTGRAPYGDPFEVVRAEVEQHLSRAGALTPDARARILD